MADETKPGRDLSRTPNPVIPDAESGTTSGDDFGKADRYANKDQEKNFNFRTIGDESAWDAGREAAITDGTRGETHTESADAEAPGVKTSRREDAGK